MRGNIFINTFILYVTTGSIVSNNKDSFLITLHPHFHYSLFPLSTSHLNHTLSPSFLIILPINNHSSILTSLSPFSLSHPRYPLHDNYSSLSSQSSPVIPTHLSYDFPDTILAVPSRTGIVAIGR